MGITGVDTGGSPRELIVKAVANYAQHNSVRRCQTPIGKPIIP